MRLAANTIAIAIAGTAVAAGPATAQRVVVTVDGRSMPWEPSQNPKRSFGQRDGRPPVYIVGLKLVPGRPIAFTARGQVTILGNVPMPAGAAGRDAGCCVIGQRRFHDGAVE